MQGSRPYFKQNLLRLGFIAKLYSVGKEIMKKTTRFFVYLSFGDLYGLCSKTLKSRYLTHIFNKTRSVNLIIHPFKFYKVEH